MSLSEKEINRYNRQIQLREIGIEGQERLKKARVLVTGAGGLGCPALQYLAAAGVGTLGIVDFDTVEESNLQRQILFNSQLVGVNKAIAAKEQLEKLNPFIELIAYPKKLDHQNAVALFMEYDLIVDGTDNFATRYLVNDASLLANKPYVYGAIYRFEGQVTVFNYKNGPTYRCLFPNPPKSQSIPNCNEMGVLGVLPGIIGAYQANEALKIILDIGEPLSGKLMLINTKNNSTSMIHVSRLDEQVKKVQSSNSLIDAYGSICETKQSTQELKELTVEELKSMLSNDMKIEFVDVRELHETPRIEELQGLAIPSNEIANRFQEISTNHTVVMYCQTGIRSKNSVLFLQKKYGFNNLWNLQGGMNNWQQNQSIKINQ